jgi:alpha-galactosidase
MTLVLIMYPALVDSKETALQTLPMIFPWLFLKRLTATRHIAYLLFYLLTLSGVHLYAAERSVDLAGAWVTQVTDRTPLQQLLVFRRQGERWTGTMTSRFGTIELKDIVPDVEHLSFSEFFDLGIAPVPPIRVYGVLRDGELHLRVPIPTGDGFTDRLARRANAKDEATLEAATPSNQPLKTLPDNGVARTPPMGWNSWNHFRTEIDDRTVREIADAMVSSGLRDAGYVYVNIDDTWQGRRDANGVLHPNSKFPDMKVLADYVHNRGLKLGIYSGPGLTTCQPYEGSYGHEDQDAKTFAEWGVDYLKYDWCDANDIYSTPAEMHAAYHKMGAALRATGRPILYAVCQYGLFDVGKWGRKVGANAWRTTFDILDYWARVEDIGLNQIGREGDAGPGGWDDPDMLEVGNGGMTLEEYRTHMTWWSMLSAPLLLGNDVRNMTPEIKALLTNKEVIAVDQDALGIQARAFRQTTEIWTKPLSDGSVAVTLFNRGAAPAERGVSWSSLGLTEVSTIRDVWAQTYVNAQPDGYHAIVPPHGAVLLRVSSKRRPVEKSLNIVFIGDSITQGVFADYVSPADAPPARAVDYLSKQPGVDQVNFSNEGHSGHTTVDALPATRTDFLQIEQATTQLQSQNQGRLIFSVMLGTNDSAMNGPLGSPVSPQDYRKNLTAIIDNLLEKYPGSIVILHRPLWYSPNTYNAARYLAEGLNRLRSYFPQIDALIEAYRRTHPNRVFAGDRKAFDTFKKNYRAYLIPEKGQQGTFYLHPNEKGAQVLGRLWSEAIAAALSGSLSNVGGQE